MRLGHVPGLLEGLEARVEWEVIAGEETAKLRCAELAGEKLEALAAALDPGRRAQFYRRPVHQRLTRRLIETRLAAGGDPARLLAMRERLVAPEQGWFADVVLAEAFARKGDKRAERARLEAAAATLDRDPDLRRRLLRLLEYQQFHRRWREVAK